MKKQKLVYEIDWLIRRVYRESDKLLDKISNTARFEDRCIKDLGEYLSLDKNNHRNKRHLIRLIDRKVKEALDNFKEEVDKENFSDILNPNAYEDGEMEFEPIDVLTDVESEVMKQETIALLTQDDRSKKVLEAWSLGNTNNTEISRMLTHTIGGKTESHRKFIQRFEKDCREKLATAI